MDSFWAWLGFSIAVYSLLNFLILPRIRTAWVDGRPYGKLAKVGVVAALESARNTALIAALVWTCFGVVAIVLKLAHADSVALLSRLVTFGSTLHTSMKELNDVWERWYVLVPVALVVYLSWRQRTDTVRARIEHAIDREIDRVNEERERDPAHWQALAADPRVRELQQHRLRLQTKLAELTSDDKTSRVKRTSLRRELARVEEQITQAEEERRIESAPIDAAATKPAPELSWKNFFVSAGLLSDLGRLSKVLSRVVTGLLLVTLVSAASSAGAALEIRARVLELDALRVAATSKKVEAAWKKAGSAASNQALDQDDRRAIEELSRQFVHALTRNAHWSSNTGLVGSQLREMLARQAVLRSTRLPEANRDNQVHFKSQLDPTQEDLVHRVATATPEAQSSAHTLADQEGQNAKAWLGAKWQSVRRDVLQHAEKYQTRLEFDELQNELLDKVLSVALEETVPSPEDNVLGKKLRSALTGATKKAVRQGVINQYHKLIEELGAGKTVAAAVRDVRVDDILVPRSDADELAALMMLERMPNAQNLERALREHPGFVTTSDEPPGGFWPGAPPPAPDAPNPSRRGGPPPTPGSGGGGVATEQVVSRIAQRATASGTHSLSDNAIDALASYEDLFPRSVASQSATALGRTLQRYQLPADAVRINQLARFSVQRAASFSMLRGYSRVGGVLIGDEPIGDRERLDIVDMTWHLDGRAMTLTLRDAAGARQVFGPFDKSLVHQALAFAADGRPVAVTMAKARPLPQLKIHLHPVLLDSPLGCRVIELDRFVDEYASQQLPKRSEITLRYEEQRSLYQVAFADRLALLASAFPDQAELTELGAMVNRTLEEFRPMAARALPHASGLFGASSVFNRKPEYFDEELVAAARACATTSGSLERYEACLNEKFGAADPREQSAAELRRWYASGVAFEPWSGVRERPFRLTKDLGFLRPPAGKTAEARSWPFDFMVQVAFVTPPLAAATAEDADTAVSATDAHPLEFTEIKSDIQALVLKGIERDGLGRMFSELRDFTVLQRLARAALKGLLGKHFPLEKLAQLSSASAGDIPYAYTRRWNGRATAHFGVWLLDKAQALGERHENARVADRLRGCGQILFDLNAGTAAVDAACRLDDVADLLTQFCAGRDACPAAQILALGRELPELWEQELAFGVMQDEARAPQHERCPGLSPSVVGGI